MGLLDLNSKERSLIIGLENNLSILTAKSNNCHDEKRQISLIEELNKYINRLNDNLSLPNTSDEFKKVINQIYSTTCQLRDSIAHRNIKKEKNTMLFGHIKTLKDWDY